MQVEEIPHMTIKAKPKGNPIKPLIRLSNPGFCSRLSSELNFQQKVDQVQGMIILSSRFLSSNMSADYAGLIGITQSPAGTSRRDFLSGDLM